MPQAAGFACVTAALCITMLVASGAVVGYMSLTTGNTALDAATATGNSAVTTCFSAGEENVAEIARQMMERAMGDAVGRGTNFLDTAMRWTDTMRRWLRQLPPDLVQTWDWMDKVLRPRMYHDFVLLRSAFVSGVTVMTLNGTDPSPHYIVYLEDERTIMNPPDGFHSIRVMDHNGQPGKSGDLDWASRIRKTPRPGCNILVAESDEHGHRTGLDHPCNLTGPSATDGKVPMGNCEMCFGGWSLWQELLNRSMGRGCIDHRVTGARPPWEKTHCFGKPSNGDGMDPEAIDKPDELLWSPCLPGGMTLKNYAYVSWTHEDQPRHPVFGKRVGHINALIDARANSMFLRSVPIPEGSRMYAIEKNAWGPRRVWDDEAEQWQSEGTMTQLVGATHGEVSIPYVQYRMGNEIRFSFARKAINSTDPTIREHAEDWLSTHYPMGEAAAPFDTTALHRWTDPHGTAWFLKGRSLSHTPEGPAHPAGLLWWVLLLVPRDVVMSTIDAASRATREQIAREKQEMEDEKAQNEAVMYAVTTCVCLILIFCSIVLSKSIVAPLHELQHRMASVAGMHLEEAGDDRPPARFLPAEIKEMQGSFHIMVEHLRVYKPFLPQSCLPGFVDVDDEEGEDDLKDDRSDCSIGSRARSVRAGVAPAGLKIAPPGVARESTGATPVVAISKASPNAEKRVRPPLSVDTGSRTEGLAPVVSPRQTMTGRSESGGLGVGGFGSRGLSVAKSPRGRRAPQRASRATDLSDRSPLPTAKRSVFSGGTSYSQQSQLSPQQGMRAVASSVQVVRAAGQLRRKQVTLCSVNIRGYLRFARSGDGNVVGSFHTMLLGHLMSEVEKHKGLTDGISGDRFHASGNGAKPAFGHRASAVRLAWGVTGGDRAQTLRAQIKRAMLWDDEKGAHPLTLSAAACSGELLSGNIGCPGLMRYSAIGEISTWVHAAERLATQWECSVVVNNLVKQDVETVMVARLRAAAAVGKASHSAAGKSEGKPQMLWQIHGPREEQETDEWMYQLEKAEGGDMYFHYNKAARAYYKGEFDQAAEMLAAGRDALPADAGGGALAHLYDALAANVARRPERTHATLLEVQLRYDTAPRAHADGPPQGDAGQGPGFQQELVDAARRGEAAAAAIRQADLARQREQLDSKKQERAAKRGPAAPALDL